MRVLDDKGNEIELKDDDDDDDVTYVTDRSELVGTTEEVLDNGFVIDEDSPEDIMDVFGSDDADTYED